MNVEREWTPEQGRQSVAERPLGSTRLRLLLTLTAIAGAAALLAAAASVDRGWLPDVADESLQGAFP